MNSLIPFALAALKTSLAARSDPTPWLVWLVLRWRRLPHGNLEGAPAYACSRSAGGGGIQSALLCAKQGVKGVGRPGRGWLLKRKESEPGLGGGVSNCSSCQILTPFPDPIGFVNQLGPVPGIWLGQVPADPFWLPPFSLPLLFLCCLLPVAALTIIPSSAPLAAVSLCSALCGFSASSPKAL